MLRVATWNLERKTVTSPTGSAAIAYVTGLGADVLVLTEARTGFPAGDGHVLVGEPRAQKRFTEDERTVLLWSAEPLELVEFDLPIDLTRFVAARTETPIGQVLILAVCITWHMAEVQYHEGPKRKLWELHLEYLRDLAVIMGQIDEPFIVAGDFNQRVPRVKGGNIAAAEALANTFDGLDIVTAGTPSGCSRPGIDHIALTPHFAAKQVKGWPNTVTGRRLSDHDGVMADVVLSG